MLLQNLVANAMGLAIGGSVPNATVGQIIAPLILIIFLIFGGLFVNLDTVPLAFRWIQWISFITYSNKAFAQSEFDADFIPVCAPGAQNCFKDGLAIVESFALGNPSKWVCLAANLGIATVVFFIGFYGFQRTSRPLERLK
jgi:hypothetical protein